ncbi:MAG: 4Fe-4S binding protein [Spirochaetales bacterium]|nr:4Fe-4S binding protein [Spirochaetales bacterium]
MRKQQAELIDIIKKLFRDKKISQVIGYEKGTMPFTTRPRFIKSEKEADLLVWNSFCTNNVAVYLPELGKKLKRESRKPGEAVTAIVAKGCDARSIVSLLVENQVKTEDIHVIGMPCTGMVDLKKIKAFTKDDPAAACEETDDGMLKIKTKSNKIIEVKKEDFIAEGCAECKYPVAEFPDTLVPGKARDAASVSYKNLDEFESKTADERWQVFKDEFSKCIRCYACRQACPNCYCSDCFAVRTKPEWIGQSDEMTDVMVYHIGRIFHQAGRCVGCDACVRACPMNIDLRLFTQKMVKDVEEMFQFVPGLSKDTDPPLCTFQQDDSDCFITEPSP